MWFNLTGFRTHLTNYFYTHVSMRWVSVYSNTLMSWVFISLKLQIFFISRVSCRLFMELFEIKIHQKLFFFLLCWNFSTCVLSTLPLVLLLSPVFMTCMEEKKWNVEPNKCFVQLQWASMQIIVLLQLAPYFSVSLCQKFDDTLTGWDECIVF